MSAGTALGPARIGLISNRNSGHNRDQFEEIQKQIAACAAIRHIETGSPADIPLALSTLAEEQIEVLAINGGDGTVSATLGHALEHAVFKAMPPVVVLPGGTANMTAGDVGARGKLPAAVQRFCAWANANHSVAGERVERSLMRVQIGAESLVYYGMFLGMGAVIQGTEYAHQEIHSRGLRDDFSGALGVARTIWGLSRGDPRFSQSVAVNLMLGDDAESQDYNALVVAISSLQHLFMGMRPFWGTGPGRLQLTLIMEKPHQFLRTFISIARGKPNRQATRENGYISYNADKVTLKFRGSLNLDGEILTSEQVEEPVTISASPTLTFIRL